MDTTGLVVLLLALVAATVFGLHRYLTSGQLSTRGSARTRGVRIPGLPPDAGPAVVQFSSEFCAPCRATRTKLVHLTQQRPFTYLDLDVSEHIETAQEHGITRTPSLLILDETHIIRFTITGAPTPQALVDALDAIAPIGSQPS